MEPEVVARGRIWTGEDALEIGLVDELGGMRDALRLAKEAAGIPAEDPVRLRVYPRRRSPLDALFGKGPDSSERRSVHSSLADSVRRIQPAVRMMRDLGVFGDDGVLTMPRTEAAR